MLKAPLTFRLYQSIKFNRPVDKEKDVISPGGYEIKVKDKNGNIKSIAFDFEDYEGGIDKMILQLLIVRRKIRIIPVLKI